MSPLPHPLMSPTTLAREISFFLVQPETRIPGFFRKLWQRFERRGVSLESKNTRFPSGEEELKQRLVPLLRVPKMSTLALAGVIQRAVAVLPEDRCFLNVGVWHGFTFLAGLVGNGEKTCVAVDDFSQFGSPRREFLRRFDELRTDHHHFYEMDYREYFRRHSHRPIGFYLFDGPHTYDHHRKGLEFAEPHLAPGALIMVDDANYTQVREATFDFVRASSHQYQVAFDQTTSSNVHPTWWNGVLLLRKTDGSSR